MTSAKVEQKIQWIKNILGDSNGWSDAELLDLFNKQEPDAHPSGLNGSGHKADIKNEVVNPGPDIGEENYPLIETSKDSNERYNQLSSRIPSSSFNEGTN